MAMSNTLEHAEVVRLRDRLADDNRYLHQELRRRSGEEIDGADYLFVEAGGFSERHPAGWKRPLRRPASLAS